MKMTGQALDEFKREKRFFERFVVPLFLCFCGPRKASIRADLGKPEDRELRCQLSEFSVQILLVQLYFCFGRMGEGSDVFEHPVKLGQDKFSPLVCVIVVDADPGDCGAIKIFATLSEVLGLDEGDAVIQALFVGIENHEGTVAPGPAEVIVNAGIAFQPHDRNDKLGRNAIFRTQVGDLLSKVLRLRMHVGFQLFCG